MKIKNIFHWIAAAVLLASILACNLGSTPGSTTTGSPSGDSSPTEAPAQSSTGASDACTNLLMPIKAGATWNYKLTGNISDTFTRSIVSTDGSSFTDQDVFGNGVSRQGKWNCDNGNLIALNPSEGGSASVSTDASVAVDFQTTELSGVTMPGVVNPGDTWTQSTTLEGIETINGVEIPAKNQFSNTCTAIGKESVTVEAGTFDAMHLDCKVDMTITITMNGQDIQTPINLNSSSWYAENIGLIKTVSTGTNLDSTIELVSYSIP